MAKASLPPADILSELVDQFAQVRQKVDEFRPTQNLHDRLWKQIKPHLEKYPTNKPLALKGGKYVIELDACQWERKVKPVAAVFERLKKIFGAKRFWELISFPVTPLDAMFDRDDQQLKNFVETSQTGSRKILSVTQIDGPAAAKAA